ncbi:hypothetical protein M407DRAFT_3671 [Tulasnella calospora MUT 4182]|uniref:Uncharacterized protein n=1 Tax=Tulasnella calospora MUT 4182 TaxID=1051891 RepID=A0A0C3QM13_9AGAM|nr:hypothetical protein M407DRAFT_3671 [Tulasnella calospora MUT 4182]
MAHIHYGRDVPESVIMRTPTYPLSVPMTRLKKSRRSDPLFQRTPSARNSSRAASSYSTALSLEDFMAKDVFNCRCCRNSLHSLPEPVEQVTSSEGSVQPGEPEYDGSLRYPDYDQKAFEAAWRRRGIEREGSGSAAVEQAESTAREPVRVQGWMRKVTRKAFSFGKRVPAEN